MNLALDGDKTKRAAAPVKPTCDLRATFDAASDTLTLTGKGNGAIKMLNVGIPGGKASVSDLKKVDDSKWTFKPTTDGTYSFTAEVTKDGQTSTCQTTVEVGRMKAACDIDVLVDPETNIITVDASGSKGDFSMTALTMPDGSVGDIAGLESVGDQKWTYDPAASLKRKPGDYTYTFAGKTELHGTESTCDTAAIIRREGAEFSWIARGYFVKTWPGSSTMHVENPVGEDPPIFTQFWVDGGNGFGGEVEYMFRPNIGIFGGITFANMKTSLMFDQGDIWLTSTDRVDTRELFLGVNYHFLPGRRFEPFLGVYADWVNYSSSTFFFQEVDRDYRIEYDNELTYGVNLGFDFPIKEGGPWIITGALRWTGTDLEGNNNIYALPVDPLNGIIGIGYRW
jgi:outer membrane protein W